MNTGQQKKRRSSMIASATAAIMDKVAILIIRGEIRMADGLGLLRHLKKLKKWPKPLANPTEAMIVLKNEYNV
jgi:hypothetical protein